MSHDKNKISPLKREPLIPANVARIFADKPSPSQVTPAKKPEPTPAPPPSVQAAAPAANSTASPPMTPRPSLQEEKQRRSQQKITLTKMPELNRFARPSDADVEAELEAAMAEFDDDTVYKQPEQKVEGTGQKKTGKIISIHGDDVFVDVGGRSQGVIPAVSFDEAPEVGKSIEIIIKGYDGVNGLLNLALPGAAEAQVDWSSVTKDMVVEARVTGTNTGGLSVEVNGIRGFLPISQIEIFRIEDTKPYVNQKLKCLVTEVNPAEKNLVLSRRALLEKEREEKRDKLWAELAEGQRRTGFVRNVKDFGAFIDLGGVDALLPAGEISWNKIDDVSKALTSGQSVEVIVTRIDQERKKVSVSLRQTLRSPWEDAELKYGAGTVVEGTVVKTMDFGAFIELEPGIEGLVHVSELGKQKVWRVTDVAKQGDKLTVKVLSFDPVARRISLSVKAALKDAEPPPPSEETPEAVPETPVKPIIRRTDLKGGLSRR